MGMLFNVLRTFLLAVVVIYPHDKIVIHSWIYDVFVKRNNSHFEMNLIIEALTLFLYHTVFMHFSEL